MVIDMLESMCDCKSNKGKGKTSAVDKDKNIRDILAGADMSKDGEYEGHVHTSSEINEMLARDEDELQVYLLLLMQA